MVSETLRNFARDSSCAQTLRKHLERHIQQQDGCGGDAEQGKAMRVEVCLVRVGYGRPCSQRKKTSNKSVCGFRALCSRSFPAEINSFAVATHYPGLKLGGRLAVSEHSDL